MNQLTTKNPDDLAGKYTKIEPPRGIEKHTQERGTNMKSIRAYRNGRKYLIEKEIKSTFEELIRVYDITDPTPLFKGKIITNNAVAGIKTLLG